MNTRCTVCHHPQRLELEAAYIGGATLRVLATKYGRNKSTMHKHLSEHVPAAVEKAAEAATGREIEAGDSILSELVTLCSEARRLQALAEKKKDVRTAITALRELVRLVELKARMLGELRDREVIVANVQIDLQTATRMAEVFLARRQGFASPQVVSAGYQPEARKTLLVTDSQGEG